MSSIDEAIAESNRKLDQTLAGIRKQFDRILARLEQPTVEAEKKLRAMHGVNAGLYRERVAGENIWDKVNN